MQFVGGSLSVWDNPEVVFRAGMLSQAMAVFLACLHYRNTRQPLGTLPSPETQVHVWEVGWLPVTAYDLGHLSGKVRDPT